MRRSAKTLLNGAACAVLAMALSGAPAPAATQVGQTFENPANNNCSKGNTWLQGVSTSPS